MALISTAKAAATNAIATTMQHVKLDVHGVLDYFKNNYFSGMYIAVYDDERNNNITANRLLWHYIISKKKEFDKLAKTTEKLYTLKKSWTNRQKNKKLSMSVAQQSSLISQNSFVSRLSRLLKDRKILTDAANIESANMGYVAMSCYYTVLQIIPSHDVNIFAMLYYPYEELENSIKFIYLGKGDHLVAAADRLKNHRSIKWRNPKCLVLLFSIPLLVEQEHIDAYKARNNCTNIYYVEELSQCGADNCPLTDGTYVKHVINISGNGSNPHTSANIVVPNMYLGSSSDETSIVSSHTIMRDNVREAIYCRPTLKSTYYWLRGKLLYFNLITPDSFLSDDKLYGEFTKVLNSCFHKDISSATYARLKHMLSEIPAERVTNNDLYTKHIGNNIILNSSYKAKHIGPDSDPTIYILYMAYESPMYKIVRYATWNTRSKYLLNVALSQLPVKTGYITFFVEPLEMRIRKCDIIKSLCDKSNKIVTWKGVKIVQQIVELLNENSAYKEDIIVCHG